jgi:diguanylate cyclase (GGDEF)-like protein/PAS domain S-box-containing protein
MHVVTKARRAFRILVLVSALVLIATVTGILVVTTLADRAAQNTHSAWVEYDATVQRKIALLTALHGEDGFAGLASGLSRYVETQDRELWEELHRRLPRLNELLTAYSALTLTEEEDFALRALGASLTGFRDKLAVAHHMAERGVAPEDVAAVVPLDEATTPMALSLLLESWNNAAIRQQARISASLDRASMLTRSTLLVVPVLLMAAGLVGWLGWRFVSMTHEAERHRAGARHTEALYRDLVEGSLQGLLIHADFKPLFVNPAFVRMFGFDGPGEAMAIPSFLDLVDETEQDDLKLVHGKVASGDVHTWTGRIRCRNRYGDTIWVEEMVRPIRWNGTPAVQVTLLDVSERVAHEGDLEMARSLTEQQAQEVVALAEELDSALQLAEEQKAELHRLSNTDPLTGVFNRRHFLERAHQEMALMTRHPTHAVSVLMMDLDHFKRINDTRGHAAGDEVLRAFTAICGETLRETDVLGRLGGEEFGVLLSGTDLDLARVAAERLRARTETLRIAAGAGEEIGLTVSIGVAKVTDPRQPFETVLSRADDALYQSKLAGRNRVTVAPGTHAGVKAVAAGGTTGQHVAGRS